MVSLLLQVGNLMLELYHVYVVSNMLFFIFSWNLEVMWFLCTAAVYNDIYKSSMHFMPEVLVVYFALKKITAYRFKMAWQVNDDRIKIFGHHSFKINDWTGVTPWPLSPPSGVSIKSSRSWVENNWWFVQNWTLLDIFMQVY